ncbi:MAG: thioredoxin family protein [Thermoplasmatota archaeon]
MNEEDGNIKMEFIYSETCPDCPPAKEAVERIKEDYEDLDVDYIKAKDRADIINKYDITHVPTIVINEKVEFVETLTEEKLRARLEEIRNG